MTAPAPYRLVRPPAAVTVPVELDAAQRAVVEHRYGPLRVLAGPGTGKTTTLVETAAARIEAGTDPESVLLLTFSRRAAAELRVRIGSRLARTIREPLARTFHSYAFGLLRRTAALRGEPAPRLLSGPEQDAVIRELLAGQASGAGGVRWPEGFAQALGTRGFAAELRDLMLRAFERGISPAQLADWGRARHRPDWVSAAGFLQEYLDVTALAATHSIALDPAELIRGAVDLLHAEPEVLDAERARLSLVLVDEYQDTDPAQEELLALVAGGGRDLIVVGDPDQSIYAFRGTTSHGILEFPERFRQSDGGPAPTLALAGCRRTGPTLLAASRRVIAHVSGPRYEAHRALRPLGTEHPGDPVSVHVLTSASQEGAYVAHRLREAHLRRGVPWSRMAVLVRSTSRQLSVLRRALTTAGVPVAVAGEELPLAEQPAVTAFLDLLDAALAPDGAPAGSWPESFDEELALGLLRSPLGGADALDLRRLRQQLRRLGAASPADSPDSASDADSAGADSAGAPASDADSASAPASDADSDADSAGADSAAAPDSDADSAAAPAAGSASGGLLLAALRDPRDLLTVAESVAAPALRIADLLGTARRVAAAPGATVENVLWALWQDSRLGPRWQRASRGSGPRAAAAHRDLDGVVALFDAAARFVDRTPGFGPRAFLDHVRAQQIPADSLAARAPAGEAVRILTAHAAKGLEWDVVVVAGVQEGLWPDLRVRGSLLGSEQVVELAAGHDPSILSPVSALRDEEWRLFYVALTRAREQVVVTAVDSPDGDVPSRLLDAVDERVLRDGARPHTVVPRQLSLPALVAELRAVAAETGGGATRRTEAVAALRRLAAAGVPGADPAGWWGVRPLSDDGPLRGPEETVVVSPSKVERFSTCGLQWLLESAGGTSTPGASQALGTLVHDVATLAVDAAVDLETLLARLDESWAELDFGGPWYSRHQRETARTMLERLRTWLAANPRVLVGSEVPFEVPVGRALLRGRVDRLERDAAGRLVVVDLKTGSTTPAADALPEHPQLGAYQVAVERGGFAGGPVASGGAELLFIKKRTKPDRQPALREAEDPSWAEDLIGRVADGMAAATFVATENSFCRMCPAATSCPLHARGRQVTQ